ncbi:hypothetical protein Bca4012_059940 [Brassica carinata]|uniref:C3H1-type domain-containing protein n=1 Tax=Brassica carinata TaxID=52824 RepID=A0A8X7V6M6_BRACI|nr:hypothetical protein Bca52824_030352 [Brassica carinata]
MSAPATQPQQHEQQKKKQSEPGEEALKKNTDCVYFLASPSTCKKGAECEYRHSEYARVNPRDCYYWLSGNCLNPKCGFRHPALGNLGGLPAVSVPPSQAAGVVKQPFTCVFFQKGMCAKGDMCSYMHTPSAAGYKKQHPVEATPAAAADLQISKKPVDASFPKAVKAHVDISVAPRVTPALRDDREGYIPKHVGYEPVVQKMDVGLTPLTDGKHHKYGFEDDNSFHNGKDADDVLRESSPGFDVFVDNKARDSKYYHVGDGYGRRSQEGRNSLNEYDPDFGSIADQRFDSYDQREDRHAWGHRRGSSERGDRLERRVNGESEGSEKILASDLRYRLAKQRKGNDYAAPESSMERGYRDSRRNAPKESSISSSRLQGRIKLRERSNDDEGHFGRRVERGRDRSDLSQSRIRDRIGSLEENHSSNQERDLRAPWVRRREMEDGFSVSKGIAETKSSKKEDSKIETSLGKRKSSEEDHHPCKRSGDSFAAPLPFSEILKRKRAAASGGSSIKNKDQTPEETISKEEAGDETKLITAEKTEVVSEPNPTHEGGLEEGTIMEEGEEVNGEEEEQVYEEEEQVYEGEELNGEYYYEEDGEYAYEEGEEVVYVAEEGEEATEGGEAEGEEDIEKKSAGMLS